MNPIPTPIMPPLALLPDGWLQLLVLLCMVALLVTYGALLWLPFSLTRLRERVDCPVRLRRAKVLFRLAPDGRRVDVLRCSVFGRRPVTCGKVCLHKENPWAPALPRTAAF
jgi:hypothetical protein